MVLDWDEVEARLDARDAAIAAFVAAHPEGVSFAATPAPWHCLTQIIVSPDTTERGAWRLTRFDRRGPTGHMGPTSWPDVVRAAAEDYGVDLATVRRA